MKIDVFGKRDNPVIVMLPGSLCPGEALAYLYSKLCDDFCVVVPTYNGHYPNSEDFTTRQNEAKLVADYLMKEKLDTVRMIYGQSMGSEIGTELMKQLLARGVKVESAFFDGAPMIVLSKAYKTFMYFKFKTIANLVKGNDVDKLLDMRFMKQFGGKQTKSFKPMLEPLAKVAPFISKQSIKNQMECCYTFDFPQMSESQQKRMYFLYGMDEKAYKTCINGVKKAYPKANYILKSGYGHCTYSIEHTDAYVEQLKSICMKAQTL